MPTKSMNAGASGHVPHPDVSVTATADKYVIPRHHRPDSHHMAFEGLLMVALGVENMYLGIVHGDDNVSIRQM